MNGRLQRFLPGTLNLPPVDVFVASQMRLPGVTEEHARAEHARLASHVVWLNDEYQVNVDQAPPHGFPGAVIWHLSIKRRNKNPVHDWRDLQAIKNVLVGPDFEAIEIYPASSRVVDTANQYHLWVFVEMDGVRAPKLPLGWFARTIIGHSGGPASPSKQRAFAGDAGASL